MLYRTGGGYSYRLPLFHWSYISLLPELSVRRWILQGISRFWILTGNIREVISSPYVETLNLILLLKYKPQFSHFLFLILNISQSHWGPLDTQFSLLIFYMIVLNYPCIYTSFNCFLLIHTVQSSGYFLGNSLYVPSSPCRRVSLCVFTYT